MEREEVKEKNTLMSLYFYKKVFRVFQILNGSNITLLTLMDCTWQWTFYFTGNNQRNFHFTGSHRFSFLLLLFWTFLSKLLLHLSFRDINGAGDSPPSPAPWINIHPYPHPISTRVPTFDFLVDLWVPVDIHGYPLEC